MTMVIDDAIVRGTGVSVPDLARLCRIVYRERPDEIAEACARRGWTLLHTDIRGNLDGRDSIVVQRGDVLAVAIAGTELVEPGDVRRIVTFVPRGGIAPPVRELADCVHRATVRYVSGWKGPVIVTGHSIGGAAAHVVSGIWDFARSVSFGAPRAMTGRAIRRLDPERILAVEMRGDPVPAVPPRPFGYAKWPRRLLIGPRRVCSPGVHRVDHYVETLLAPDARA